MPPSAKDLVWPVGQGGINVSWDPDSSRLGQGPRRSAPYHTVHIPFEPLTTPRIDRIAGGVLVPNAENMQGRLAESWESSDDFRTWTVRLRKGVLSNFGNELTAETVKWCWDRVYSLKAVGYWRSEHLATVRSADDVKVIDKYTIQFKTEGPNPEFAGYLGFATNNIADATEAKKHATADDPWAVNFLSDTIAGFGAFALKAQTARELSFTARDEYWAGRPGINTLTQVGVGTRNEAFRMLESGDANFAAGLYPEELARFAGRKEFTIDRVMANHSTLEFNWKAAPFDDQNVRQAVCYALPYQRILDQVYSGYGKISKTPIPSVSKYSTDDYWQYNTDLDKAKELLKASGHADGFETQLYIQPSYESLRFSEIVRESLAKIGIIVEVRLQTSLPFGTKVPMWFREECGHAMYEPMYDLGHDYDPPPRMWNDKNIVDPLWTDEMAAIRAAPAEQQGDMYRAIQRDIVEFAPCAHIAEIETGWVWRGDIDPWARSHDFMGAITTVWSAHRQILGWW